MKPTLEMYLMLSAVLFCVGLAGVMVRRHAILSLISIEIMLNAANLNLLAFWRFQPELEVQAAPVFAMFLLGIAAAEAAVGLAIVLSLYRSWHAVDLEKLEGLRG